MTMTQFIIYIKRVEKYKEGSEEKIERMRDKNRESERVRDYRSSRENAEKEVVQGVRKKKRGFPTVKRYTLFALLENTVAPISRKLSRKRPFSRALRALAAPRMHVQLGRVPRGVWSEWLGHESRSRSGELASYQALSLADGWKLRMIAGVARAWGAE